jgi:hypothetical protein
MSSATQCAFSDTVYGSEDYQASTPLSHHVHFADTPMVYVPAAYPVYTDYYIPADDDMGPPAGDGADTATDQPSPDAEEPATDTPTGSPSHKMGLRHPRYSRRVQSKSEPSTSSSAVED